ncbi:MAG: IS110 family transposase [Acidobacteria bacterium]|nr:IS110 family transposase [Acidobacteriota bacterium]
MITENVAWVRRATHSIDDRDRLVSDDAGIGPITATAFIAALDDATRFRRPGQVESYLGLVPCEYSSGEKQRRGGIMRSAHPLRRVTGPGGAPPQGESPDPLRAVATGRRRDADTCALPCDGLRPPAASRPRRQPA